MNAINSMRLFNKSAGVKEEIHCRSSGSSMIWRLKPVSLSVIRRTRSYLQNLLSDQPENQARDTLSGQPPFP